MDLGRKFWYSVLGLLVGAAGSFYAMAIGVAQPDALLSMVSVMVLAYNGGNAAATFAHTKTATVSETVTREIKARRALTDDGTEATS